jgi:cytochrome c553
MKLIASYRNLRAGKGRTPEILQGGEGAMDMSHSSARTRTAGKGRGRRTAKIVRFQLALQVAILAVAVVAAGRADAADPSVEPEHGFTAKIRYCQDCHGPSGQGYRGFVPIPRLAGQQPEYFKNQLQAFVERRRTNDIMLNVAHVLTPSMITALATNFRAFNPRPLGGAPRELVAAGKQIFQDGVPDANIAACAACHGPDASGHEQIPRLAGQLYWYVVRELGVWDTERGQNPARPDTSATMLPIAHSLNRKQMEAVAAYVSSLQ